MPPRFEGLAVALASGTGDDVPEICRVIGRHLAADGAALTEALDDLRATTRDARSRDPEFAEIHALATAWSESTLEHLHTVSCEDPLTGLSQAAHLRTRLRELYRGTARDATPVPVLCALVVVDFPNDRFGLIEFDPDASSLDRAMRLTRVGEIVRTVFSGSEVIARVGPVRVVALVEREERLGRRVALVRTLLDGAALDGRTPHVWIEGLPGTDAAAALLLDELSR